MATLDGLLGAQAQPFGGLQCVHPYARLLRGTLPSESEPHKTARERYLDPKP